MAEKTQSAGIANSLTGETLAASATFFVRFERFFYQSLRNSYEIFTIAARLFFLLFHFLFGYQKVNLRLAFSPNKKRTFCECSSKAKIVSLSFLCFRQPANTAFTQKLVFRSRNLLVHEKLLSSAERTQFALTLLRKCEKRCATATRNSENPQQHLFPNKETYIFTKNKR